VLPLTRQIILNPFKGYSEDEKSVMDSALEETVKELAGLDGAFLIRGNGVIETAGAFLKIAGQEEYELPMGLGARHHAASGITSVTNSIAITVSESTGMVTVFRGGKVVVKLERPFSIEKRRSGLFPEKGDGGRP
jgi:DNA integrity scanning protein DisA with diadenylate cyclase activity